VSDPDLHREDYYRFPIGITRRITEKFFASATVDLISGVLGKNDNLLLEIKKLRKTTPPPKPDNPV
jgi:hypothetical protein